VLRPIGPGDAIRLVQFHERLSDRTVYFRFFAAHPHLTPSEIERFTHVDHVSREAYVAVLDDRIIGVGRWDAVEDSVAEVAFVIADDYQHQGLGSVLFSLLAEQASAHGITTFFAEMLPQNRGMRRLFEVFGTVTEKSVEDGVLHIAVTLDALN
jgi:GNAT superfamily N-acetyltransferase